MSSFEIELLSENNICVELCCLVCERTFSTEIDLDFSPENELYSNSDVLYCFNCETPYEYNIKFDSNILHVEFKNDEIVGTIKYSSKIHLEEYKTSSTKTSKRFYYKQIERLKIILEIKNEEYIIDQSLNRLIYTGVITSLETYLNEVFILIVFHSERTLERFVSGYEPYQKERLSLHEIIVKYNTLEIRVREDLDNFIYHNIPKLIRIFNLFDFELEKFNKLKDISQNIQKRHNLIHRSGLDESDNFKEVSKIEVETLINNSNLFVEYIDEKIEKKCFIPGFDLDLPF